MTQIISHVGMVAASILGVLAVIAVLAGACWLWQKVKEKIV